MFYLILGFAPGIYWLLYFIRKDKLRPEPQKLLIKAYFLGILTALLVIIIQLPLKLNYLLGAVIIAPVLEESAKYLAVRIGLFSNPAFDEPVDGIIYAAAVALGFASLENVIYLYRVSEVSRQLLSNVVLIRSLLSVPGHALFSGFWGHALGKVKFLPSDKKKGIILTGLILAIISHALFNFLCFVEIYSSAGLLLLIALLWAALQKNISTALQEESRMRLQIVRRINTNIRSIINWKRKLHA
ncbi:MAG: PrsW family intramembrane metalloprotease [Candidatus Cloacimonetes bacterium]|nr:PrsW family intramembrane metalloprotease [Candidatus Cloacimonadota bacterium]